MILFLIFIKYFIYLFYFWSIKIVLCNNEVYRNQGEEQNVFFKFLFLFILFLIISEFILFYIRKKKCFFLNLFDFEFTLISLLISFNVFFLPMIININNLRSYRELLEIMESQIVIIRNSFYKSKLQNYKLYLKNNKDKLLIYDSWNEKLIIDLEKEIIISKGEDKLLNTNDDAFMQLPHFEPFSE